MLIFHEFFVLYIPCKNCGTCFRLTALTMMTPIFIDLYQIHFAEDCNKAYAKMEKDTGHAKKTFALVDPSRTYEDPLVIVVTSDKFMRAKCINQQVPTLNLTELEKLVGLGGGGGGPEPGPPRPPAQGGGPRGVEGGRGGGGSASTQREHGGGGRGPPRPSHSDRASPSGTSCHFVLLCVHMHPAACADFLRQAGRNYSPNRRERSRDRERADCGTDYGNSPCPFPRIGTRMCVCTPACCVCVLNVAYKTVVVSALSLFQQGTLHGIHVKCRVSTQYCFLIFNNP